MSGRVHICFQALRLTKVYQKISADPVLRILDVYPGSEFFPSRIRGSKKAPDLRSGFATLCRPSVLDPDPDQHGYALIWLSWILSRIHIGNANADAGARKFTKISI